MTTGSGLTQQEPLPGRLRVAHALLHALAAVYLVTALVVLRNVSAQIELMPGAAHRFDAALTMSWLATLIVVVALEGVAWGVRRRRFWAWVGALCAFGYFVPTYLLPLGVLGLWALLAREVREAFGVHVTPVARPPG